eukprot:CAMPEP_0204575704 /NCGR_PEP_ID=MMETSP0661-20131031/41350_1 /ASSEMBLY_ACC=CAM_ASM_000606 /TAXON_ID=109239 /ORGANISM="Alexandrium margalefi, Strain AMGDE01CS-322" /LENGTH=56 /DNA_ID=CAMNT_0051584371 /DNA_START=61 /DNA_END=227 /DNA_ORIENTATION=+
MATVPKGCCQQRRSIKNIQLHNFCASDAGEGQQHPWDFLGLLKSMEPWEPCGDNLT